MGRRKQSVFEDLIDVAALLPWQAALVAAVVAYSGFHYVATLPAAPTEVMTASNMGKVMGESFARQMFITLSTFLQYLVPVAFLIGAVVSVLKRRKRERLYDDVATSPSRTALERISWAEFETLVGEAFRRKGFEVIERGGNGPDGGVDLELRMGGDRYLVQCKQWKAQRVGVAPVRELFGVMAAEGAAGGYVVASGEFTEEAARFAEGRAIKLVEADGLLRMVRDATGSSIRASSDVIDSPRCPACGGAMVQRTAKRGENAGGAFWGCSNFPACRGIRKSA